MQNSVETLQQKKLKSFKWWTQVLVVLLVWEESHHWAAWLYLVVEFNGRLIHSSPSLWSGLACRLFLVASHKCSFSLACLGSQVLYAFSFDVRLEQCHAVRVQPQQTLPVKSAISLASYLSNILFQILQSWIFHIGPCHNFLENFVK